MIDCCRSPSWRCQAKSLLRVTLGETHEEGCHLAPSSCGCPLARRMMYGTGLVPSRPMIGTSTKQSGPTRLCRRLDEFMSCGDNPPWIQEPATAVRRTGDSISDRHTAVDATAAQEGTITENLPKSRRRSFRCEFISEYGRQRRSPRRASTSSPRCSRQSRGRVSSCRTPPSCR